MPDTLVMIKEDTRRTVQLGDNNPLGTIDNKSTIIRHQWHFTHENRFGFNHLLQFALVMIALVINSQTHPYPQRRGVSDASQLTFTHVKFRSAQFITDILQFNQPIMAYDRKNGRKGFMQTNISPFVRRNAFLQKITVRINLH